MCPIDSPQVRFLSSPSWNPPDLLESWLTAEQVEEGSSGSYKGGESTAVYVPQWRSAPHGDPRQQHGGHRC